MQFRIEENNRQASCHKQFSYAYKPYTVKYGVSYGLSWMQMDTEQVLKIVQTHDKRFPLLSQRQ